MARSFNKHNETEMRLINVLAHSEGLISREDFVHISNKSLLSRYKAAGYIEQAKTAGKNVFQITELFKREYCKQIDPFHRFSGSHSFGHSSGLNRVLSHLPVDASIQTGSEILREFNAMLRDNNNSIYARLSEIQTNCQSKLFDAQQIYSAAKTPLEQATALAEVHKLEHSYQQLTDEQNRWSIPDVRVSMEREQLKELIDRTQEHYEQCQCSDFQRQLYNIGLTRMNELYATGESKVELNIEIITNQYGPDDIQAKEVWAECCNTTPIIYISV